MYKVKYFLLLVSVSLFNNSASFQISDLLSFFDSSDYGNSQKMIARNEEDRLAIKAGELIAILRTYFIYPEAHIQRIKELNSLMLFSSSAENNGAHIKNFKKYLQDLQAKLKISLQKMLQEKFAPDSLAPRSRVISLSQEIYTFYFHLKSLRDGTVAPEKVDDLIKKTYALGSELFMRHNQYVSIKKYNNLVEAFRAIKKDAGTIRVVDNLVDVLLAQALDVGVSESNTAIQLFEYYKTVDTYIALKEEIFRHQRDAVTKKAQNTIVSGWIQNSSYRALREDIPLYYEFLPLLQDSYGDFIKSVESRLLHLMDDSRITEQVFIAA